MEKNNEKKGFRITGSMVIKGVILLAVLGIYTFITQYFMLVPINIHSAGFWFASIIFLAIAGGMFMIFSWSSYDEDVPFAIGKWLLIAAGALLILLAIFALIGSPLFNATRYANLIEITDGDEVADIPDIETDELVIVDQKNAEKLGDRQLAFVKDATYYEVDNEYNLIKSNGRYVRVSPLNYGGYFKSRNAGSIPGYIEVEATNKGNTQKAEAVMFTEPMVYAPSAYWSKDLGRHLHFNYPTYMFGKNFFEFDDEGTPYWITPVRTPSIFLFGGALEKSVVITNAVTGECKEYAEADIPSWVDHAHSVSYMFNLVQKHYTYRDGFWNSAFGKKDVFNTSYAYRDNRQDKDESEYTPFVGYNWVIAKDGDIYAYTGITPANNAESNIGFVLVNARTMKAYFYDATGAEESSAQKAAEGLVQNLRYSATFPTIIDINGEMAYIMVLKDNAGLVKRYAICNVNNYSKVVQAETLDQAIDAYMGRAVSEVVVPEGTAEDETHEVVEVQGKVLMVSQAEKGGNTYFYIVLEGDEHIYVSPITISSKQPVMLKEGADVTMKCYASAEEGIEIVTQINFK